MKDPIPNALRLRPTVLKARYHETLNLEGLDTVILDGALVSPLALAKVSNARFLPSQKYVGKILKGVLFLSARVVTALSSCQQGTAPRKILRKHHPTDYRTYRPGSDWFPQAQSIQYEDAWEHRRRR